jgi:hypothetical protein
MTILLEIAKAPPINSAGRISQPMARAIAVPSRNVIGYWIAEEMTAMHLQQVPQGELDAEGEHQEGNAKVGEQDDLILICDDTRRIRPYNDSRKYIPDKHRQPEALGDPAPGEGKS